MKTLPALLCAALLSGATDGGCVPLNNPYPAREENQNVFYTSFSTPPKDLDPAVAYNSNELALLGHICEPPFQYHYLKRPYELEPLTVEEIPAPNYFDAALNPLPADAEASAVERVVYEFHLKKGIRYADHPCFARNADGRPLYLPVDPVLAARAETPGDFAVKGTRELVADDYVYAFKRLANPMLRCPVRATLSKYLVGMKEYAAALKKEVEEERARRKRAGGAAYVQALDERARPIALDLDRHPFPGIEAAGRYTFRLTLNRKYPQILYWLAMPFFSPVPPEAAAFYAQGPLQERNITLNRFPVGTGPFQLARLEKNRIIELSRNPNYHDDFYPTEGMPQDREAGLLEDARKRLPFLDKIVFSLEKEAIPTWNKFLQGYYDSSGISSESFERAVSLTPEGSQEVAGDLAEKGVVLRRSVVYSTNYFGFNMEDPVVGGYGEKQCKLRQAIGIAIDTEERIRIFMNGRGIVAMSPIPPGIFGHAEGEAGIDPYTYAWDPAAQKPRRKPIEDARRLLAQAGYPGGIGPDGKQLVIGFDNSWEDAGSQPALQWLQRQFARIGIHLEIRTTHYNRFQEKIHGGNYQFFSWGWNADYPDPENFLFLLYGPNSRKNAGGANSASYNRPEYDEPFRRMESMENGPERLELIRKLVELYRHDAPWVGAFYPVAYGLGHGWTRNVKPNEMSQNHLKFKRIDVAQRNRLRRDWNRPRWDLVWTAGILGALLILPAWISLRRRERRAR